jgi:hypothetical protein
LQPAFTNNPAQLQGLIQEEMEAAEKLPGTPPKAMTSVAPPLGSNENARRVAGMPDRVSSVFGLRSLLSLVSNGDGAALA